MAIKIKNYKSHLDVIVKEAYMAISNLSYSPRTNKLNFIVDIFASEDSYKNWNSPLEKEVIFGSITVDESSEIDLVEAAEKAILAKIEAVHNKTFEECEEHNSEIDDTVWENVWDIDFQRYESIESSEEDISDYEIAAKILLGESDMI